MVKLWVFCQFGEQCFFKNAVCQLLSSFRFQPFFASFHLTSFSSHVARNLSRTVHHARKSGTAVQEVPPLCFRGGKRTNRYPVTLLNPGGRCDRLKNDNPLNLQVPVVPMLGSIEVSSIAFNTAVGSLQRKVYLFMQRLDCDGKATGPPVPLAVTDTVQFSVPLKLKLFAGDRARLVLYQSGTGLAVSEVILSGCILANADCYFAYGRTLVAMSSWTPEPFRFVRDSTMSASRKRSHSPQPMRNQKNCVSSDEPPTLIYAPVFGGDDES
ncbi:LOW QUALITY PROTEIN: hypothetical protein Q4I32_002283 [Leishmania shawi]|uniref:Uncharacterized protein n=1 Tax=Leishmania shawi TaxID=5680 RepID=A0AAW3C465_9TRYP